MQTNQSNPSAPGDTERVSSDEIARMLGERGILVPNQAHVAANQPQPSSASSGVTNPFTSSELAHIYSEGRVGGIPPTGDEPHDAPKPLHPSIRIIMEYSHAISVEVAPFGSTESDAEAASRQRCVELDTQPGPNAFRKLAVVQSKKDLGVSIKAVSTEATGLLHCKLSFDPVADRIVMTNRDFRPVVAKLLAAEDGGGAPVQARQPTELKPYLAEILEPGSWAVLAKSGQHILDLSILPRRNIAIVRTLDEPIESAPQGTKREYDSSQLAGPDKKGKLKEEDSTGEASIVFQPAPEPSPAAAIPQAGLAIQHEPTAGVEGAVTLGLRHPLEDLRAGDMAKILGPGGEDYTLTYDRTVSLRSNSHVFTAQHSDLPEKLMVVKAIRSPSGPIPPGASHEMAGKLQQMAEMWLREVRIHSRLSQHASVVRLHDHDSRFLALYMENIDAPSLAQYPCSTLTAVDTTRILYDISSALYYMHRSGFAHNDIKPANILFSPARGAVLIDFGLSTELSNKDVHTGGTPWYVPPEFMIGGRRGTPGDVFALGVVMLYVLGKLPLPELRVPRLQWRIAEARIPMSEAQRVMRSWQDIIQLAAGNLDVASSKAEELVKEMVAQRPESRISIDSLVDELSALRRRDGEGEPGASGQ